MSHNLVHPFDEKRNRDARYIANDDLAAPIVEKCNQESEDPENGIALAQDSAQWMANPTPLTSRLQVDLNQPRWEPATQAPPLAPLWVRLVSWCQSTRFCPLTLNTSNDMNQTGGRLHSTGSEARLLATKLTQAFHKSSHSTKNVQTDIAWDANI